jgi:hypothetical protein
MEGLANKLGSLRDFSQAIIFTDKERVIAAKAC